MGTPILTFVYDRRGRASKTKEGSIELRITYDRTQRFVTTGVRVLPQQWKRGCIANRLDAFELQRTLDLFMSNARRVINEQLSAGTFDIESIGRVVSGKAKEKATENLPTNKPLIDFFRDRATIRKYGGKEDTQERYDRFLRWFERWGGMVTFADITDANIIKMDAALGNMKPCSKWGNYHRFLNSFIIDAVDEGLLSKNPYKSLHIDKDKSNDESINKYLTREEFTRLSEIELPCDYLRRARDLFVFQTYTCLAYVDLEAFDPAKIQERNGKYIYSGHRGKTGQQYTFLLMRPALDILARYGGQLPMVSNQKYNHYIKMVAVMAGINKPVSTHWARHTGATMLLNSGVGIDVVARILGHSSTKITREIYAHLHDDTVADAMAGVEETFCRR